MSKYFNIVFKGVLDAINGGVHDINNIGRRVILPRSFDESPRDLAGKYQDAMAICKEYGKSTSFITFTANPNWKEARDSLLPGQCPSDRPNTPDEVDQVISAELPDPETDIYETIGKTMVPRPCGPGYPNARCMVNRKCSKGYPWE